MVVRTPLYQVMYLVRADTVMSEYATFFKAPAPALPRVSPALADDITPFAMFTGRPRPKAIPVQYPIEMGIVETGVAHRLLSQMSSHEISRATTFAAPSDPAYLCPRRGLAEGLTSQSVGPLC
jgi:hypothetical protein